MLLPFNLPDEGTFMRNICATAVVTAATLIATSAHAEEKNWTGFYVGVDVGVGFNLGDSGELEFRRADGTDNSAAINTAFGDNFDGKFDAGNILGLKAGIDWRVNNWAYGVIFDIAKTDLAQEQSAFSSTPATYVERRTVDTLATFRGRLAWAANDTILPYVTAGLAYGDVEYSWQGNSGAFRGDNGNDSGWQAGYTVGIGVEVQYSERMSFGLEYSLSNLGNENFQTRFDGGGNDPLGISGATMAFGSPASGGTVAQGTDDDFDFQTLKLSWNYKLSR